MPNWVAFFVSPIECTQLALVVEACTSGRLRVGVGSNGIQPYFGKNASTQACASRSVTL
jgi:hypothetical protein